MTRSIIDWLDIIARLIDYGTIFFRSEYLGYFRSLTLPTLMTPRLSRSSKYAQRTLSVTNPIDDLQLFK